MRHLLGRLRSGVERRAGFLPRSRSRFSPALNLLGELLAVLGLFMLAPAAVALGCRESAPLPGFAASALVTGVVGLLLAATQQPGPLTWRSSLWVCVGGWVVFSLVGALPLWLGTPMSYLDATYEAASGFTTTGFTVLGGLEALPRSILLWRAAMQWIGGLGILSFFLLVSFPGGEAYRLLLMEGPKTLVQRPAPGIYGTLRILWGIYLLITGLNLAALLVLRAGWFNALGYALATASTGGFGLHDANLGYFAQSGHPHAVGIELVTAAFALAAGMNFLSHHLLLRGQPREAVVGLESRAYWTVLVAAIGLTTLAARTLAPPPGLAFGDILRANTAQSAFFLSSAGFYTQPLSGPLVTPVAFQVFMVLMFIGGCIGSTAGGLKMLRVVVLWRYTWHEIRRFNYPSRFVMPFTMGRRVVAHEEVSRIVLLGFFWGALVAAGSLLVCLLGDCSPLAGFTVALSAVSNMGPSLLRPAQMAAFPAALKLVCIFLMIAGRLEILPVLALFSRSAWQ